MQKIKSNSQYKSFFIDIAQVFSVMTKKPFHGY